MSDKRRFTRIDFEALVHIRFAVGQAEGVLQDISLHGVLVTLNADIADIPHRDTECEISIQLPSSDITLAVKGRVAHVQPPQLGIEFEKLDIDAATHLRRLVELNLGSEDLLQRQIFMLWQ